MKSKVLTFLFFACAAIISAQKIHIQGNYKVETSESGITTITPIQPENPKADSASLAWWEEQGENGSAALQMRLAMTYYRGYGVEENDEKAYYWFAKAAENGDVDAQVKLAESYCKGDDGLQRDYVRSAHYAAMAAKQGNDRAQYRLGFLYLKGYGVEKNTDKAVALFRQAAEQDNPNAIIYLAQMYESNFAVEPNDSLTVLYQAKRDTLEKHQWDWNICSQLDVDNCYFFDCGISPLGMGDVFYKGEREVSKDDDMALYFWNLAADSTKSIGSQQIQAYIRFYHYYTYDVPDDSLATLAYNLGRAKAGGEADFQYSLSQFYEYDSLKALGYLQKSAENGLAEAQNSLGFSYFYGNNALPMDSAKAFYWFQRAAAGGNYWAKVYYAKCYFYGIGTAQNYNKSFELYSELVTDYSNSYGIAETERMLGLHYYNGLGTKKNRRKAVEWWNKAVKRDIMIHDDDNLARYYLGVCYADGKGVKKDGNTALYWFITAKDWADFDRSRSKLPDEVLADTNKRIADLKAKGYIFKTPS